MNNLTLRQLRAFQAVAATRSFTKAAQQLHLTPAALSGLIKELEAQMGVRMFDRSTRKVNLSAVGEEFFPLIERVLQDLDAAVRSVTHLKDLRRGVVRIAAPEVMSCTLVPRLMAAFRTRHPQIELRFLDVTIEEVVTRTARGEVDIGIAPGLVADPDVTRLPFMRANLMLAVPAADPLARRRQVPWSSLRDRPFVTFFRGFAEWAPYQRGGHDSGDDLFPRNITFVRRINTALAMVQAGFGITVCPVYARDLAESFDLKLVRLGTPEIGREYALLMRAGHALTPAVSAFCDFALEYGPGWARARGEGAG